LIAFGVDGLPRFPRLCERMLAGHRQVPVMFVCFDLLAEHGEPLWHLSYRERRRRLEALAFNGPHWTTTVATDDCETLWQWVCARGLEGVGAERVADRYGPGERRWLKIKNRREWRYPLELADANGEAAGFTA
jgi:bifunctional non-homologous end joining protein LigD